MLYIVSLLMDSVYIPLIHATNVQLDLYLDSLGGGGGGGGGGCPPGGRDRQRCVLDSLPKHISDFFLCVVEFEVRNKEDGACGGG